MAGAEEVARRVKGAHRSRGRLVGGGIFFFGAKIPIPIFSFALVVVI